MKNKNTKKTYRKFIRAKQIKAQQSGFKPIWMPDFLYDFQAELVEWSLLSGRSALFEDCGLGKTPQQLVWSENIVRKTNKRVLIIAPLAVSFQTMREAEKFHLKIRRTQDGVAHKGISITNYERLKSFSPKDFVGVVCDESSILKNFDGKTRKIITKFVQEIPYRLLCSATPAPNDYMELGTSSEALSHMKHNQMLAMFFSHSGETTSQWILKGHAKRRFWQWMSIWSRAIRKPSDLGYKDDKFILPKLHIHKHYLESPHITNTLLPMPAVTLNEQRAERRLTLKERCEKVKELQPKNRPYLIWCHLNDEGDTCERIIDDAVQISGRDSDDSKESKLVDFCKGNIQTLITKPRIAGFGLNWQHCSDATFFPSHSYEQFYQCIRRCWRFGQKREVQLHLVASEREKPVVDNMIRKEKQVNEMYDGIVSEMSEFQYKKQIKDETKEKMRRATWM